MNQASLQTVVFNPSFAGHMGNLTGQTEKNGTEGAFGKECNVDTICLLGDVDPTGGKAVSSDNYLICQRNDTSYDR